MADSNPSSLSHSEKAPDLSIPMETLPSGVISSTPVSPSLNPISGNPPNVVSFSPVSQNPSSTGTSKQPESLLSLDLNSPLSSSLLLPVESNLPYIAESSENQPGHSLSGLSEHLFEGDLPFGKGSESNILAASEELVIQSLTSMKDAPIDFIGLEKGGNSGARDICDKTEINVEKVNVELESEGEIGKAVEGVANVEGEFVRESQVVRNVEESEEDDDNVPLVLLRKNSKKGKEKMTEEGDFFHSVPRRTRGSHLKLMTAAMEANRSQTVRNRKKRESLGMKLNVPVEVVEISIEEGGSENKQEEDKSKKRKGEGKEQERVKSVPKRIKKRANRLPESSSDLGISDEDDAEIEGPGPKLEKMLSKEERKEILKTQKVLPGRVIDPEHVKKHGLRELVDDLVIQGWDHLFSWPLPILYEKEVREFYVNMEVTKDGSINSLVNGCMIHVSEKRLAYVLKVPTLGIKSVAGKLPTLVFLDEIGKMPSSSKSGMSKKFLKGLYQVYFEFINKNLLPRTEKRTVATGPDLFLMESLSKMDEINLPAIMMEHMIKIRNIKDGKHGLAYGYLLGKVFQEVGIPLEKGIKATMKQVMSFNTLIECECVESRGGRKGKSQVSELLEVQEQLRHEIEELFLLVTKKDAEIVQLKAQLVKSSKEGPGSAEVERLRMQNAELTAKIEDLKDKLLKNHEAADARVSLILQNLQPRPPPSF